MNKKLKNHNSLQSQRSNGVGGLVGASSSKAVSNKFTGQNKKRVYKFLAAAVLLVLVSAGSVVVYSHFNNKPEKVLADALGNTVVDLLEGRSSAVPGTLILESEATPKTKIVIKLDSKTAMQNSSTTADATVEHAGKKFNLKASVLAFGNQEYYFKIENLKAAITNVSQIKPTLNLYLKSVDPVITKIDNKWVKVTKTDVASLGASASVAQKCSSAIESLRLTKADIKDLKKLFKENQFLTTAGSVNSEEVDGENSFHYKLDFNNAKTESFVNQVFATEPFSSVKTSCGLSETKTNEYFKKISPTDKSDIKKPIIELWVGKNSRRPTRLKVVDSRQGWSYNLDSRVKLGAGDVNIAKPTDSISVTKLKAEFEKLVPQTTTNLQTL